MYKTIEAIQYNVIQCQNAAPSGRKKGIAWLCCMFPPERALMSTCKVDTVHTQNSLNSPTKKFIQYAKIVMTSIVSNFKLQCSDVKKGNKLIKGNIQKLINWPNQNTCGTL